MESKHKKTIEAIKKVKLCLIMSPDFTPGWKLLVKLYSSIGEFEKASILHERIRQLSLRQGIKEWNQKLPI